MQQAKRRARAGRGQELGEKGNARDSIMVYAACHGWFVLEYTYLRIGKGTHDEDNDARARAHTHTQRRERKTRVRACSRPVA